MQLSDASHYWGIVLWLAFVYLYIIICLIVLAVNLRVLCHLRRIHRGLNLLQQLDRMHVRRAQCSTALRGAATLCLCCCAAGGHYKERARGADAAAAGHRARSRCPVTRPCVLGAPVSMLCSLHFAAPCPHGVPLCVCAVLSGEHVHVRHLL